MRTEVAKCMLMVQDMHRAIAFYRDALGFGIGQRVVVHIDVDDRPGDGMRLAVDDDGVAPSRDAREVLAEDRLHATAAKAIEKGARGARFVGDRLRKATPTP